MRRPRFALISLIAVLIALSATLHADKRKKALVLVRPDQSFEIPDAPKSFATSARACANDMWGAAVATALKAQDVVLPAKDFAFRLAGGDACMPTLPEFDILRKSVENDYPFGNGRRFRIRLERTPGPPDAADPLAIELHEKRPLIFIYRGRPLLLYGLTYDEHILNNLRKELWITELRLVDPAASVGSEARIVKFKRHDPRTADIEGVIKVVATPIAIGQLESR
jgi:hypothetical protein